MSLQKQNRNTEAWSPSPKGEGSRVRVIIKAKQAATMILIILIAVSCNRKPFVNSKLKIKKIADDCKNQQGYFRMVSGFAGERYEFEKCLPDNFSKDQMSSLRKGDTVVLNFVRSTGGKNVLYKLTVDIDSYPKYNFVTVDGDTYKVIPTKD